MTEGGVKKRATERCRYAGFLVYLAVTITSFRMTQKAARNDNLLHAVLYKKKEGMTTEHL